MRQIVVISGKGGTGKTSVTAGLATVAAPLVLADCDVDAADLHLVLSPEKREIHDFTSGALASVDPDLCTGCGACVQACRYGAVDPEMFAIRPEHCEGCGACEFVCPAGAARLSPRHCGQWFVSETRLGPLVHAELAAGAENSGKLVSAVRAKSAELAEAKGLSHVLVDGSPGIGCPVIASLTGADAALLVAEPTVSAFHDLSRVARLLDHFRIPGMVLLNKCDVHAGEAERVRKFCAESGLPLVGELPVNPLFVEAQLKGLSVTELDPSGLGAELAGIWERLNAAAEERVKAAAAT